MPRGLIRGHPSRRCAAKAVPAPAPLPAAVQAGLNLEAGNRELADMRRRAAVEKDAQVGTGGVGGVGVAGYHKLSVSGGSSDVHI